MQPVTQWPNCHLIENPCLVYQLGASLSNDVMSRFFLFVATAQDGAQLTLQRNQEQFVLRIAGEIRSGKPEPPSQEQVRSLAHRYRRASWKEDIESDPFKSV